MTLKVIGAGFGRTGTMSMKFALEQLGYNQTHHMISVMHDEQQRQYWHDIAMGKQPDWDAVFDGFEASVDFPSCSYYQDLLAHYPDARVVLTVRDPDRWYRSASDTIYAIGKATPRWARKFIPSIRQNAQMVNGTVWNRVFQDRFEDEAYAKQVFRDYIEQVKSHVPADRLLVFEVSQGWGPLCAFLGKEIPDTPFPNVNDSEQFQQLIRKIRRTFFMVHAAGVAGAVALTGLAWWAFF
jgi:Sulfotransferase domain